MESGRCEKKKTNKKKTAGSGASRCSAGSLAMLSDADWVPIQQSADGRSERAAADAFEQCASRTSAKAGPVF